MMRTKEVKIGDEVFKIRALTWREAKEYSKELKKFQPAKDGEAEESKPEEIEELEGIWKRFVCDSLTLEPGSRKWTPEDIDGQFDMPSFTLLRDAALTFTYGAVEE